MTCDGPAQLDQRRFLRVPVVVAIVDEGGWTAYAINISAGGLCLQTREPLEKGRELRLRFRLPGEKLIATTGEVVWADCEAASAPSTGLRYCEVGVRFLSLSGADRRSLEEFVTNKANFWLHEEPSEAGQKPPEPA